MTVAVLVCGDGLEGIDRELIAAEAVEVVDGLCRQPHSLSAIEGETDGLVLAVHGDEVAEGDVQAQIRAGGLDPLGVPTLDLADFQSDPSGLRIAIAGAVARASAFPGSSPAHAKPVFPTRLTRRSLFTIPRPAYVGAPAIDSRTCAAGDGCAVCVGICPRDAYIWAEGKIVYDKDVCEPCGRCVTTCPTGAISNPVVTPAAIAAQIDALVAASPEPLGVAFRCARAKPGSVGDGWQTVEVPCTGMVTAPWALAPLLLGVAQVAVLPCSTTGCDRGLDSAAEEAVEFAIDLLMGLGIGGNRVGLKPNDGVQEALPVIAVDDPFGPRAAARVYSGLRAAAGSSVTRVAGNGATLGVVAIDRKTCTMCTMCVQTCPTGALAAGYRDDGLLAISFDTVDCTACDQCVAVCPEAERGAIAVEHRADFTALAVGRVELNSSTTHTCESCGQPVAPTATMDRLADLLGDEPALVDRLTRLCLACRGTS